MRKGSILSAILLVAILLVSGCGKTNVQETNLNKTDDVLTKMDIIYMKAVYGEQELELEKSDETWKIVGHPEIAISQNKAKAMAETLGNIESKRDARDEVTLSESGVVNPQITVIIKDAEGNVAKIFIGNQLDEGGYYAAVNDKAYIHVVGGEVFGCVQYDFDKIQNEDDDPFGYIYLQEEENNAQEGELRDDQVLEAPEEDLNPSDDLVEGMEDEKLEEGSETPEGSQETTE